MKTLIEVYNYRHMVFSLVRKDLRGRYKGSALGFLWTFINPLLQLCIYTIVFSTIMRMGIEKFYIFLFVALVPWIFFNACLQNGSTVVLYNQDLVKKIYFPRIVLPIAYVTSSFVNMLLSFIVVFAVLIFTGYGLNPLALIYLPLIMVIEYILCLGIALITSACTVYLRDLEHILGIVGMAWMYLTPVIYSPEMVPEKYLFLFNLNPMTPIVEAYRDILYYKQVPQLQTLALATGLGVFVVVIGSLLFNKLQKGFIEEL
jgi:ABC-2 type transport system permease protein